ncbi:MAG: hypothetical protein LBC19_09635 [Tannerella sp.]|nr:hypothetical protein [Tannerella sp.]
MTKQDASGTEIELIYGEALRLTVHIAAKEDYFRMELVEASPGSEISHVVWGHYQTTMRSHGEQLGVNRSEHFTIGALGLEPNTDGNAGYTDKGSLIQLASYDHTRDFFGNRTQPLRKAEPLPGVTPVGSAVALRVIGGISTSTRTFIPAVSTPFGKTAGRQKMTMSG